MYKVCAYAICKNEIKHIKEWLERVKEADVVVVLDTGSTDGTWEVLQDANIICAQKIIEPFRFDVARNEALNLVPKDCDICFPLEMDMYLCPGWANMLKHAWAPDISILRVPQYFKTNNTNGYWIAHAREGGAWHYPVYEVYKRPGRVAETYAPIIIHDWDVKKSSHGMYLELAELAVQENPLDPYCRRTRRTILKEQEERKQTI